MTTATAQALPRRIPTPQAEPPYDDEVVAEAAAGLARVDGALALADPPRLPASPVRPELRLVRTPAERSTTGRPDARAWALKLAQAVTEVLAGDRPATQLLRWTTARIYADLSRRAATTARELTVVRSGRTRPKVTRVVVCDVREGVVEASAIVDLGARTRAMAMRLEASGEHWVCTVLQMP